MEKISSNYVLNEIFNYIENKEFKLKLLIYSKLLQKKLKINISDYLNNYLDKLNLELDYLLDYSFSSKQDFYFHLYYLNMECGIDKNSFLKILPSLIELYLKRKKGQNEDFEQEIYIFSVFFNKLIKKAFLNIALL